MRRVAIGGAEPKSRTGVPLGNEEWDIWSLNNISGIFEPDLWFDIHKKPCERRLEKLDCRKIVRNKNHAERYQAEVFPIKSILNEYGPIFASSPEYMTAMAIGEGYEMIGYWGLSLQCNDTYRAMRPYMANMLAICIERGIEIFCSSEKMPEPKRDYNLPPSLYCYQHLIANQEE